MQFFTTVPRLFGKGIHIWLGLVLLVLLSLQAYTGLSLSKGIGATLDIRNYHKANAYLLISVVLVHAYYGIGLWFLGFKYRKKKS